MNIQDKAKELAEKAHKGQIRKFTNVPYIEHPKDVVKLLKKWGVNDEDMISAAFAHDILEDTNVSESNISSILGKDVLNLVKELTKPENTVGKIKKQKWILDLAHNANARAVLIKLADRICNVNDFIKEGKTQYAQEYFNWANEVFERVKKEGNKLGHKIVKNAVNDWKKFENYLNQKKEGSDMNNNKIAKYLVRLAKNILRESSMQRYCEIWKAQNNKWYIDLANKEHGDQNDATTYGPFVSEGKAEEYLNNFSNPGGWSVNNKGDRPVPKRSPNGYHVQLPEKSMIGSTNELLKIAKEIKSDLDDDFLKEVGVFYSFKKLDPLQKEFTYKWEYTPTGKKGVKTVFCDNERDFLKLINHWNRDYRWKYTAE